MNIDEVLNDLIKVEGGYVNNPNDAGGETNFGITKATAQANGYIGDMRNMNAAIARSIYRKQYIEAPKFDKVAAIMEAVGCELIDTGVNMGVGTAAKFLQRSLNVLGGYGLVVDGKIGQRTLETLIAYKALRGKQGETVLLKMLNSLQGARYIELVEQNAKNRTFVYGWFNNRVNI